MALSLKHWVCPLCFKTFAPGAVMKEYPVCNDCSSEAIEMTVEPLEKYLRTTTLKELRAHERSWAKATEFTESYKQEKLKRMQRVIEMKQEYDRTVGRGLKCRKSRKK